MSKSNNTTAKKSTAPAADAKPLTVADVARELNIDPKRARAYLRKNISLYTMRHQKFTRESSLFKAAHAALSAYKNKNKVVTA